MNPITIKKLALAFGLLAFGILAIGSVLMGSRVITGVIRGGLGALIFGGLVWGFANLFLQGATMFGSYWNMLNVRVSNQPGFFTLRMKSVSKNTILKGVQKKLA